MENFCTAVFNKSSSGNDEQLRVFLFYTRTISGHITFSLNNNRDINPTKVQYRIESSLYNKAISDNNERRKRNENKGK